MALDGAEAFSIARHTRGDNASVLIYASTYADFLAIDCETIEIVAVTGNSMGCYSALACAGALSADEGFHVVDVMGDGAGADRGPADPPLRRRGLA